MMKGNASNIEHFDKKYIVYKINSIFLGAVKDPLIIQLSENSCPQDAPWDWNSAKEPVMLSVVKMDNVFMDR